MAIRCHSLILGDPGAVSRVDKMLVVKAYCKIDLTVNFHHKHFMDRLTAPGSPRMPQSISMVYSTFTLQASCLGFRRCVIERACKQTNEFNLEGRKLFKD